MPTITVTAPSGESIEMEIDRIPRDRETLLKIKAAAEAEIGRRGRERKKESIRSELDTPETFERSTLDKAAYSGAAALGRATSDRFIGAENLMQNTAPWLRYTPGGQTITTLSRLARPVSEAAEAAEEVAAATPGNELVAGGAAAIGSAVGSAPAAMVPGVGPIVSAVDAGLQSYESTRRDALKLLVQAGVSPDDAESQAHRVALQAGVITGGVTGAFNKYGGRFGLGRGVERGLSQEVTRLTAEQLQRGAGREIVKSVLKESGGEATEEAIDQTLQEAIVRWQYDPSQTLRDAALNVLKGAAGGAVGGGVVGGPGAAMEVVGNRRESIREISAGKRERDPSGATPPRLDPERAAEPSKPIGPETRGPGTYVTFRTEDGRTGEIHVPPGGTVEKAQEYLAKTVKGAVVERIETVEMPSQPEQPKGGEQANEEGQEVQEQEVLTGQEPESFDELPQQDEAAVVATPPSVGVQETTTGRDERTGSEMTAEREERPAPTAATTATPSPKKPANAGMSVLQSVNADRPFDFLDWLEGTVGKIRSKAYASEATSIYYGNDYDAARGGIGKKHFSTTGAELDSVAQAAFEAGQIAEPDPELVLQAMYGARKGREEWRTRYFREHSNNMEEVKKGERFERAAIQGKRAVNLPNRKTTEVLVDDLMPGDEFELAGEKVRVKEFEFDETDTMTGVVLDDGRKFGTQTVAAGTLLKVDQGSVTKQTPTPEETENAPFSLGAAPRQPLGKARADAFVTQLGLQNRINVVDDANWTARGRQVRGVMMKGTGEIRVNAAAIESEEDLARVVREELLHDVFDDPLVQQAWNRLRFVQQRAEAAQAEGYRAGSEATEEATIDEVEARAERKDGLWRRFLGAITRTLARRGRADLAGALFGLDVLTTEDAKALVGYAFGKGRAAKVQQFSNGTVEGPGMFSLRAFHGTPHKVDRFSTDKIGSGEGGQAYGWGLYFAENPEVADSYATKLTEGDDENNPAYQTLVEALRADDFLGFTNARQAINGMLSSPDYAKRWDISPKAIRAFQAYTKTKGRRYTVTIDADDEDLLDFDAPLKDQPSKVKDAVRTILLEAKFLRPGENGPRQLESAWKAYRNERGGFFGGDNGSAIYDAFKKVSGGDERNASKNLLKFGVRGLKYADAGSREGRGKKTRNYVVFDDKFIKITEENGQPIGADGGERFALGARVRWKDISQHLTPDEAGLDSLKRRLKRLDDSLEGTRSPDYSEVRYSPGRDILSDPEKLQQDVAWQKRAGRVVTPLLSDLAYRGAQLQEELGTKGMLFSAWSRRMLEEFGDAVEPFLSSTWRNVRNLRWALGAGMSATAQDDVQRILAHGEQAPSPGEQTPTPVFDPEMTKQWWMNFARPSAVIRYFGGDDLLRKKGLLDMRTAYQAAAVKEQSEQLLARLEESFYGPKAKAIPRFLRPFLPRARMRRFMRLALPIAAHLNVTGGTPAAWTFYDFDQRAGFMPESEARKTGITTGQQIFRANPVTGSMETLEVGPKIELEKGAKGFQLIRKMPAARQQEIWDWARTEFPEFEWFLNMWLDPALKDMRVTINGVEVPVFNRFALAERYAKDDPQFRSREAYTPDVALGLGLIGTARRFLKARRVTFKEGTVSPGRKYETGTARETGNVLDLLSGFNVRAMQVLQESVRKEWSQDVLAAATDLPPEGLPQGWVPIENAMSKVWEAVQTFRKFDDPLNFPQTTTRLRDDDSPQYKAFFGELLRLKNADRPKMVPEPLVDSLIEQYQVTRELGIVGKLARIWARNWKAFLLLMPDTFIENRSDNYIRFLMQAHRQLVLSAIRGGDRQSFIEAKRLAWAGIVNLVPGVRPLFGLNNTELFNRVVREKLPSELFDDKTRLADLWTERGTVQEEIAANLNMGLKGRAAGVALRELGPLILETTGYGTLDVAAKQQFAFTTLLAKGEAEAHRRGLRGAKARQFAEQWVLQAPEDAVRRAIDGANRALLNYKDTPQIVAKFARSPLSNLLFAFPLFRYHFVGREIDRATAAFRGLHKTLIRGKKLTKYQWASSLADTISYVTLPLMGYAATQVAGALADSLIQKWPDDDDEDARNVVGASTVFDEGDDGSLKRKPLPRELVTANRINVSRILRGFGVETGGEQDWWWLVKDYPVIRSTALMHLAASDAKEHGPIHGFVTLMGGMRDFMASVAGTGQAVKVPAKIAAEFSAAESGRPAFTSIDPYATAVPLDAYLTLQALNLIPGQRQANEVMKWLDPIPRRVTRSKSLDYDPGVKEALQAEGWTGLGDRIARGITTGDPSSPLPPQGTINRRLGFVETPRKFDLAARIATLSGQNIKPVPRTEYEEALRP